MKDPDSVFFPDPDADADLGDPKITDPTGSGSATLLEWTNT